MRVLRLPALCEDGGYMSRERRCQSYFKLELIIEDWTLIIHVHINVNVHKIGVLRRRHGGLHCKGHFVFGKRNEARPGEGRKEYLVSG